MTDLSGIESNKVFKTGVLSAPPYYYISAHLNLSGLAVPEAGVTLYFNKDNNYDYLDPLKSADYANYYPIDSSSVIGEVVAFSNPDVDDAKLQFRFDIGGALDLNSSVSETWGGKTGFTPGLLDANDIANGSICYFGHEGGDVSNQEGKYLAVTINSVPVPSLNLVAQQNVEELQLPKRARRKDLKQLRQVVVGETIASGILHVVLKIYPKFQ
jgi:hypothetical protein